VVHTIPQWKGNYHRWSVLIKRALAECWWNFLIWPPTPWRYLIDPADPPKLPKAVRLLWRLISLSDLDREQLDSTKRRTLQCWTSPVSCSESFGTLLGRQHDHFLTNDEAFTYTHLSFVDVHLHALLFLTTLCRCPNFNQKFALLSSQQQLLDATKHFHMDKEEQSLENNFSKLRCGHIKGLLIYLASITRIISNDRQESVNRHHNWNRGHHRSSLWTTNRRITVILPRDWLTVGSCNLVMTWRGRESKSWGSLLTNARIQVQFNTLFQQPKLDMLRPMATASILPLQRKGLVTWGACRASLWEWGYWNSNRSEWWRHCDWVRWSPACKSWWWSDSERGGRPLLTAATGTKKHKALLSTDASTSNAMHPKAKAYPTPTLSLPVNPISS